MKLTVLLLCVAALTGCAAIEKSPVGQLTLADAQTASSMAKQAGYAKGQACYDYIATQLQATSNQGTCALLCLNEAKRTFVTSSNNIGTACGGVLPLVVAP